MANKIDRQFLIQKLKEEPQNLTNDEKAQIIEFINTKRYGLVWEDSTEKAYEQMKDYIPVLVEDENLRLVSDNDDAPNHILIEGDNLHALHSLCATHEGKVDVIYIDPPYNTGNNDFVYNDRFIGPEDDFRHSQWLSFMKKRLQIARRLLSDSGCIFISIDDNEQANLKILCDEVFGYSNYINTISVKAKSSAGASGGGEDKKLKKNIEYLLFYVKQRDKSELVFPLTKRPLMDVISEKREEGRNWMYTSVMYKKGNKEYVCSTPAGNGDEIKIYRVTDYQIKSINEIEELEGISEAEIYNKYIYQIFTTENAQTSIRQRVKDAVGEDSDYYIAEYVPTSGRNKGVLTEVGFIGATKRLVSYLSATCHIERNKVYKLNKVGTLWDDLSWSSVSSEGGVAFPAGKKPVALIERIIKMHPSKDIVVLDFFGGSGSTAHATMVANEDDGGYRKSIICTNNENSICEIKTYPRIRNVIDGYGRVEGLTNNNLRYYRTRFVPREKDLTNVMRFARNCVSLLCIKHDVYNEQEKLGNLTVNKKQFRYFKEGDKQFIVILDVEMIEPVTKELANMETETPIPTYVFTTGNYPYTEDFWQVSQKVELYPYPTCIYGACEKDMPKMEDKLIDQPENIELTDDEANFCYEDLSKAENYPS